MKSINVKLKVVSKKTIIGDKRHVESTISNTVGGWTSRSKNSVSYDGFSSIMNGKMYGVNYEKHRTKIISKTYDKKRDKWVIEKQPTHYIVTIYEIPEFVFDILPKGSKLIQKNNYFKIIC